MHSVSVRTTRRSLRVALAVTAVSVALLGSLAVGMHANVAHASATPVIVQSASADNMSGSTGGIALPFPNAVTSGDLLVALVGWGGGNDFSVGFVEDFQNGSF